MEIGKEISHRGFEIISLPSGKTPFSLFCPDCPKFF
jgi:hypothetical protein